jgi:L-threonylcarbamoyladenylate synthase
VSVAAGSAAQPAGAESASNSAQPAGASPEFVHLGVSKRSRLLTLADLDAVARSLAAGGLAVLPTETGYMLAALATSESAVRAAFAAKGRDAAAVMHVACASLSMARRYGHLDERATALLGAFTPGPLSVVVPQTGALPDGLVTVDGTVGIRVPDSPATLQVISAVGAPLTATSVNLSGQSSASVDLAALPALHWPPTDRVYVVVDDEAVAYSAPSTLVRLTGPEPEILRPGPVTAEMLREYW